MIVLDFILELCCIALFYLIVSGEKKHFVGLEEACTCLSAPMEVREQPEGIGSLPSPYRSWGSNPGFQAWSQVPLPAELSCWPVNSILMEIDWLHLFMEAVHNLIPSI